MNPLKEMQLHASMRPHPQMMQHQPPVGPTVMGCDLSHYDGAKIDYKAMMDQGYHFAMAKCMEYVEDDTYEIHKSKAEAAGILFTAYDFFHPAHDPKVQAQAFLQRSRIGKDHLPPMLDWETADKMTAQQNRDRGYIWVDTVSQALGTPIFIYGGAYFINWLNLDERFKGHMCHVAEYGVTTPLMPQGPWKNGRWSMWQKSSTAEIPGVPPADEDLDIFNGSLEDLKALVIK